MKKIILTFGGIAGAVVAIMIVLTFSVVPINYQYGEIVGYTTMIIAFSTIFIAVRGYRENQLGGSISFGKAFQLGIGITLVASAIYIITWMIVSNTIATDFMAEYYQHSLEKLQTSGLTEAEIAEKTARLEQFAELYKNPIVKIGMTFLEIFPVGFAISLLSAFILKKK